MEKYSNKTVVKNACWRYSSFYAIGRAFLIQAGDQSSISKPWQFFVWLLFVYSTFHTNSDVDAFLEKHFPINLINNNFYL